LICVNDQVNVLIQPENDAVITQGELTAAEVVTYCGILSVTD
jgi:hypothetical protein